MKNTIVRLGVALAAVGCSATADSETGTPPEPEAAGGGGAAVVVSENGGSGGSAGGGARDGSTAAGGSVGKGGSPGAVGAGGAGGAVGAGGAGGTGGTVTSASGGAGGTGGFVPPTCANGSTALPPEAPALTPGVWKQIGPSSVAFGANGSDHVFTQGMAKDPCNAATLYLAVSGYNNSTWATIPGGLFRTTDAGSSWTKLGPFDQVLNIRVDPKNPLHMYVGDGVRGATMGFWVTTDGGATWKMPQGFLDVSKSDLGGDVDVYHVEPDPTDFDHVLVSFHWYWDGCASGCTSGVLESFDGGENWTVHPPIPGLLGAGGHDVFFLYDPALGIGDGKTWLFATQGAGHYRTADAGQTWAKVTDNSMEHGGGQLYYTKAGLLFSGGYPHIMKSADNGKSWTTVGQLSAGYMGIVGDGTSLYASAHDRTSAFITAPESDGATWTDYNAQVFGGGSFEMVFDSANGIVYSANTEAGLLALKVER